MVVLLFRGVRTLGLEVSDWNIEPKARHPHEDEGDALVPFCFGSYFDTDSTRKTQHV